MARDGGIDKGDILFVFKCAVYQFDKACNQPEIAFHMAGKIDDFGADFFAAFAEDVENEFSEYVNPRPKEILTASIYLSIIKTKASSFFKILSLFILPA